MNEKAERINGWAAMIGVIAAMGQLRNNRSNYPRFMVNDMLLIAASMVGGFVFANLLTSDDVDDDDGPDGGLMTPVYAPTPVSARLSTYGRGSFFMPRNQISIDELKVRVMKLKHELDWEPTPYQAEKDMAQKYLSYVLNILDEYRY